MPILLIKQLMSKYQIKVVLTTFLNSKSFQLKVLMYLVENNKTLSLNCHNHKSKYKCLSNPILQTKLDLLI